MYVPSEYVVTFLALKYVLPTVATVAIRNTAESDLYVDIKNKFCFYMGDETCFI